MIFTHNFVEFEGSDLRVVSHNQIVNLCIVGQCEQNFGNKSAQYLTRVIITFINKENRPFSVSIYSCLTLMNDYIVKRCN